MEFCKENEFEGGCKAGLNVRRELVLRLRKDGIWLAGMGTRESRVDKKSNGMRGEEEEYVKDDIDGMI